MRKKICEIKSTIIGAIIGTILGVILLLTGCGQVEEENSGRVVEAIDENGNVIQEETSDLEASANQDNLETQADVELVREVEATLQGRDYLAYMSEDELKSLASEALEAKGLDTRLADGYLTTKAVTFELPEGFKESSDKKGMYITRRYPIDATNILYAELPVDYTLQLMDKEYFKSMIEELFLVEEEESVDVTISEFSPKKIDGVPGFRIKAEYDLDGNHITHLMMIINGSKTYTLIYTMTDDYDRLDWFEESIKTIKVSK